MLHLWNREQNQKETIRWVSSLDRCGPPQRARQNWSKFVKTFLPSQYYQLPTELCHSRTGFLRHICQSRSRPMHSHRLFASACTAKLLYHSCSVAIVAIVAVIGFVNTFSDLPHIWSQLPAGEIILCESMQSWTAWLTNLEGSSFGGAMMAIAAFSFFWPWSHGQSNGCVGHTDPSLWKRTVISRTAAGVQAQIHSRLDLGDHRPGHRLNGLGLQRRGNAKRKAQKFELTMRKYWSSLESWTSWFSTPQLASLFILVVVSLFMTAMTSHVSTLVSASHGSHSKSLWCEASDLHSPGPWDTHSGSRMQSTAQLISTRLKMLFRVPESSTPCLQKSQQSLKTRQQR